MTGLWGISHCSEKMNDSEFILQEKSILIYCFYWMLKADKFSKCLNINIHIFFNVWLMKILTTSHVKKVSILHFYYIVLSIKYTLRLIFNCENLRSNFKFNPNRHISSPIDFYNLFTTEIELGRIALKLC